MTPIQQMLLGAGAKKKTYMDDIFSTYVYKGDDTTNRGINNGINLSGDGGMVMVRPRNTNIGINIFDTARGANKQLWTDADYQEGTNTACITQFNNNGFNVSSNHQTNGPWNYWSTTFRKAPGFFDIVTYNGNGGSSQSIAHNLGCVPGMIIIKNLTTASTNWIVYHRDTDPTAPEDYMLRLNLADDKFDASGAFYDTKPTATHFTVGNNNTVNDDSSKSYVAYLFAGGESDAATARSVDFNSTDSEYLSIADDAAFQLGTGDFTIEFWWKGGEGSGNYQQVIGTQSIFAADSGIWRIGTKTNANKIYFSSADGSGFDEPVWDVNVNDHSWHHIAITRASGYIYCYVDGTKQANVGESNYINRSLTTSNSLFIGKNGRDGTYIDGQLSNVRIVKGTAVYTSSFKPSTTPLTNITNTTLLCCNSSSNTGKTVGPTITAHYSPTAKADSPFDDPAGFVFGENGDQNAIKCGSYVGNGDSDGPEVALGWEPQWIITKCATNETTTQTSWNIFDNMRGAPVQASKKKRLWVNGNWSEDSSNGVEFTSYGFKIADSTTYNNKDGETYVYIAVRRSDGYIGKQIDTGTDVFAMDTGNSSSTIPTFDSGFPVDFAFYRKPADTSNPWAAHRSMGEHILQINSTSSGGSGGTDISWDSNVGWESNSSHDSTYQSWMWKRHAGFDVVTYDGVSGIRDVPHSLGKAPEMIWIKRYDGGADEWVVGATGLDSGGWNKFLKLNTTDDEASAYGTFSSTAPSTTHFTLGTTSRANYDGQKYVAMLFASVPGVSKVGSYDGSSSDVNVSLGFQPRFVIIKAYNNTRGWTVMDTTRGWGSGVDNKMMLDSSTAQVNTWDYGAPTSTGFTVSHSQYDVNYTGWKYIYYAHA